jgi:hypothetical protein
LKVKVFIVFHQVFDERLALSQFSRTEIDEFFVPYGVNARHADKKVTDLEGRIRTESALLEYKLGWYDPRLQARGFMETSCYVHLLENELHASFDYVGIAQYDMRWSREAAQLVRRLAAAPSHSDVVYGIDFGPLIDARGEFHPLAFPHLRNWDFMLESYNRFFGRRWDRAMLAGKPLSLLQTRLMPREQFADLAAWLEILCEELYPWANQPPYETHWGVLGGHTETAQALFVAARLAEGAIRFEPLLLEHDQSIAGALGVSVENYGERPNSQG